MGVDFFYSLAGLLACIVLVLTMPHRDAGTTQLRTLHSSGLGERGGGEVVKALRGLVS